MIKKEHYVFLIGGVVAGWGNFSRDEEALEHAKTLVGEKGNLVGFYKQVGSTNIPSKEGK